MPSSSLSQQLALPPLACHDRPQAPGLSCYRLGSCHNERAVRFKGSSSKFAQTQAGSAEQHLGSISGCSACMCRPTLSTSVSANLPRSFSTWTPPARPLLSMWPTGAESLPLEGFSWNLRIPCEDQLGCQLRLLLQYISLYLEHPAPTKQKCLPLPLTCLPGSAPNTRAPVDTHSSALRGQAHVQGKARLAANPSGLWQRER